MTIPVELVNSFIPITSSNMKDFLNAIIADPISCMYSCTEGLSCPLGSVCKTLNETHNLLKEEVIKILREEAIKIFIQLFSIEELFEEML